MILNPVPCSDSRRRKFLSESAPSTCIEDLSDDLLLKVLYKLPGDSAVRCMSVSKRWYSLISNPCFVDLSTHLNRHRFEHTLTFFFQFFKSMKNPCLETPVHTGHVIVKSSDPVIQARYSKRSHVLDFVPCFNPYKPEPIYVLASFDDLLLCCETRINQSVYYICNPSTKKCLKLPPAPSYAEYTKVALICYPCDCADAQYKYKVVRILVTDSWEPEFEVEIFCTKTGDWICELVELPIRSRLITFPMSNSIVVHNGILHWLNLSVVDLNIIAYDPVNDATQCRVIDLPKDLDIGGTTESLGVTQGRLRILQLIEHNQLCVWELEDYDAGKWRWKHNLYFGNMVSRDPWLKEWAKHPKDVELASLDPYRADVVYLLLPGRFVLCDMRRKTLKVIRKLQHAGEDILDLSWPHVFRIAHPWWPTAVPPLPLVTCHCERAE